MGTVGNIGHIKSVRSGLEPKDITNTWKQLWIMNKDSKFFLSWWACLSIMNAKTPSSCPCVQRADLFSVKHLLAPHLPAVLWVGGTDPTSASGVGS